ncbi:FUSC family protein [Microbacterium sp. HD4P20]|uniref:FUSC family protein n=1 Tax=Microbacterium sp. HD4P20 TaxID=2864874 RepID=UPI001C63F15F|nr:FUSC family protein [Microbacterium sp. HD4P20]MCP2635489.1 FUSC family protein [Microbacterium sp. HD4P20]
MDVVWIVVGVLLLGVTLLDAFLAVLNYDQAGVFVDRIVRAQWVLLRAVTRRVGRRWRPLVLRQVTGILILITILWWVAGVVFGFAFIYLGAMGISGAITTSTGAAPDFLGALYLSLGQFATVGVDNIGPSVAWLNLITVAEAMMAVVMLSFIITFLGSVYGVIQSLQSLSANFFRAGTGIADPIESLTPFFLDGRSRWLDGQLDSILGSLSAYADGLAQNRAAYYFQSGRDQFSLPFSLYMTSGVIGALRWGLPTGSDPSTEPGVVRLTDVFEDFRVRLEQALRLSPDPTPAPVSRTQFDQIVDAFLAPGRNAPLDPWVVRFLTVDRRMAQLTQSDAAIDRADAHRRYTTWLPFEFQAQALLAAVARDLDYQPIYRRVDAADGAYELLPADVTPATRVREPSALHRFSSWMRRRALFVDPGFVRLSGAARTIAAVAVAVAVIVPLAQLTGSEPVYGAVLAGLIALFASPAAVGAPAGTRRWLGIVAIVPTAVGVALGSLLPREPLVTVVAIALIAATAVWLRRYGTRAGGLGQLGFIAFYFSLMLGLGVADVWGGLVAAGVGLVCSWAANLPPGPSLHRRLSSGVDAVCERTASLLGTMLDLVATGRRDPRLVRILRHELASLQTAAEVTAGRLDGAVTPGLSSDRALALRVRIFDVQLAAENLATLVPVVGSVALTIDQRATLSAELADGQAHLASFLPRPGRGHSPVSPPSPTDSVTPTDGWPADARRTRAAIAELRVAVDRLQQLREGADAAAHERLDEGIELPDAAAAAVAGAPAISARSTPATASGRLAVQAGISTGLALLLGSLVSTSHQYWAAMPAFAVLSGSDGETRTKALQRVLATLAGATIAFGLAIFAGHSPAVAFPLLIASAFFIAFLRPIASVWTVFWQTMLLATMYDVLATLSVETVQVRVVETAIGAVVAVVVSAIVLPTRTRVRLGDGMRDVVGAARSLSDEIFERADDGTLARRDIGAGLQSAAERLATLETLARPVRRNPGSLRRSGIEAQLTALWSVLYYVRRASNELRDLDQDALAAIDVSRLALATSDNFAAVEAVLSGELPLRLQQAEQLDVTRADVSDAARRCVLLVVRLNQALLSLVDAIRPGTVAAMTASHPAATAVDSR